MSQSTEPPRLTCARRGKRSLLPTALLAVTVALTGTASGATLYRWTDSDGNVQYSDRPPEKGETKDYEGPRPPTVGEALELEARIERDRKARERQAAREAAEREAALAAARPKDEIHSQYSCEEAKGFAEHYADPDQEFYTRSAEGGFVRSTPEQVAATLAEWRSAVQVLCAEGANIVQKKPE